MAKTRSSVFSIQLNGEEVRLELNEILKEKIVELIHEEYSKNDLRKSGEKSIISDFYEISIKKIG